MENCTKKQSRRGNATVYTIAALLAVGFIGTAVIKMAQHDVIGGTDYYQASKARVAAKAGLQQFEHIVENLPDSIIQILYSMAIDSVPTRWVVGDSVNYQTLNTNEMYRVEAIGIDPENFVLHVRADGLSRNSRASIHAFYKLGNLELKREATVDQDFALYIGDVNSFLFNAPVYIDGNSRVSGNVDFDLNASGSVFDGVFRTSEETNYSFFQGTYTFTQKAYFGTGVALNGNSTLIFGDTVGFEARPKSSSGTDSIISNRVVFLNGPATGGNDFTWDLMGQYLHKKDPNENGINFINSENREVFPGSSMDVATTIKLSRNICMPDLDQSAITPSDKILQWSDLKNGADEGGPLAYYPTAAWDGMDGKMANDIWEYANSQGKLWRGFAVVNIDVNMMATTWIGDEKFKYKMILMVPNLKKIYVGGLIPAPLISGKMFGTTTDANLVLWAKSGGTLANIGGWGFYRGYIYADAGATLHMGGASGATFDPFVGAIHVQDGANMQWYPSIPNTQTSKITYDAQVIEDLRLDEFLTFPCAAGADTSNDSIVFVDGFGIDKQLRGMNY